VANLAPAATLTLSWLMSDTFPLPLTPYERMALEAVEQGCLVTPALLERLRRNGWVVSGKAGGGSRIAGDGLCLTTYRRAWGIAAVRGASAEDCGAGRVDFAPRGRQLSARLTNGYAQNA
jgi:hypothetical protein